MRTLKTLAVPSLAAALAAACSPPAPSGAAAAAGELRRLFAEEWADRLGRDPLFASSEGLTEYNDRLPDVSPEAWLRRLERDRGYLARLRAIDRDALPPGERLNRDLFEFVLGHRTALAAHRPYRIPFLSDAGFHIAVQSMHQSMPFATVRDYENYLSRLRAVGPYFAAQTANMREGLAEGFTQPRAILDGVAPSIRDAVAEDPADSAFFAPFEAMPERLEAPERERLRAAGRRAIEDVVNPAYRDLLAFFTGEYMPGARESLGASELENGRAYYGDLTRFFTTLDDAEPDAIHELGLREVARIRAEMEEVIREAGFDGGFAGFIEHLRTDPRFYADEPEQLLKEAAHIAKKIDGQMPAFFRTLPRMPYGVQPVPDNIAPNYTTGRYWGAPKNGRRGGWYMVNTYALDKRPLYTLAALTAHEGVPGHHHQISLSEEETGDRPAFRRAFYPHAFGEGWGLYAEKLGIEMGIYPTPYDDFGRLSYEMWRAVRLVVDTGIHDRGWTREEARDFLAENSALSLHNVRTEIDRYISWPGQALAYKMGELKILELRARAEEALGARFDIRDFHDAVLANGGLPLDMLDAQIDRYIERAGGPSAP